MNKIIEIEELGFPKSLIIRENALVSELIDTKDLVVELNEQLRQCNTIGQSEQCNHHFKRVERGGEFQGNQCECGEWEDLT